MMKLLTWMVLVLGRVRKLGLQYALFQGFFKVHDVYFDFRFGVDTRGRISIEKLGGADAVIAAVIRQHMYCR